MICALTSASMSDAVMVVSLTVARGAAVGSLVATGDGVAAAGAGVAAGFGAAGREFAGRRDVCAAATMNNKAATEVARIGLVKFIKGIFLVGTGGLITGAGRTIIFEAAAVRQSAGS